MHGTMTRSMPAALIMEGGQTPPEAADHTGQFATQFRNL